MKIDGFLNVLKPGGMTSAEVSRVIKRTLGAKKVGYIGTLDPIAEGVLPVGLGKATRLFPFLEKGDKVYEATLTLGAATDTQDREGKVVDQTDPSSVTEQMVKDILPRFTGQIEQIPPMYSAKKVKGERLYALARRGIEVEREPITATISRLEFHGKDGPNVKFTAQVTTGSYVRTLCHDIGAALGVFGHLSSLTRTRSGHFEISDSVRLDVIEKGGLPELDKWLISLSDALGYMSKATVISHAIARLRNGMPLGVSDVLKFDNVEGTDYVRIVGKQDNLIGVGVKDGLPIAGFPFTLIKPKKVFL